MIKKIAFLCVLFVVSFSGYTSSVQHFNTMLSPEQARQDIEQWLAFLEQTHPDLSYTVRDAQMFYQELAHYKQSLQKPISVRDFTVKMMTFNRTLSDGHLSITPSELTEVVKESMASGSGVFPFKVTFQGDDLVIKSRLSGKKSSLQGYKINRINGQSIVEILPPLLQRTHGDTDIHRKAILATRFAQYYWLYYGEKDEFILDVEKNHSINNVKFTQQELAQNTIQDLDKRFESTYQFYTKGSSAVLTVKSFSQPEEAQRFKDFFQSAFNTMKAQNIEHLLIDIRGNGGGDDSWKQGILPYIANKPWRSGSTYSVKILPGRADEGEKVGDVVQGELTKLTAVESDNPYLFNGKVSVLVDGFSYSSSILFTNVMQDFGFGQLIGSEIGGKSGQTGGTQKQILTHSKLKAISPRFILARPNGDEALSKVKLDMHLLHDAIESDDLINQVIQLSEKGAI